MPPASNPTVLIGQFRQTVDLNCAFTKCGLEFTLAETSQHQTSMVALAVTPKLRDLAPWPLRFKCASRYHS
jgi:hypothetical protein